ncbi:Sec-independent protein translocase protein TatA [Streptacidiphilus sp. MAP12-33]|uniref:sec-independent translocase n=1 Tax=Streptacidiphilus sp. MAP12-33 TaxID=3156266 RepID=UPI003516A959
MFFDIGMWKLAALAVVAVLLIGPDKLPKLVAEGVGLLRKLRQLADSAKQEVRDGLGPELGDFEFEDLNPRTFVRKQLGEQAQPQAPAPAPAPELD